MVTKAISRRPNTALLDKVPYTDDPVEFTLRCVLAMAPQLNEAIIKSAEEHVRHYFGESSASRQRVYAQRNDHIRRLYMQGERVGLIARRFGLSRSQVHRILSLADE
jgi:hypothetical protein